MLDIKITRTATPKAKPTDETKLGFGKKFSDHMFVMDYTEGEGWHDARIVPYGPFELDPATVVFHYAQEIFEGMKAYRTADDTVQLFRPDCNAKRFQDSADRLCIPKIPVEDYIQAVETLVDVDRDWVPHTDGASLYIRPFIFANDVGLGVHASKHYIFCIICAPSGAYYAEGINPVRIYVEDEYIRAAPGLTGFTKCGGNYAASIKAGELAEEQGYAQVLWLDGVEKKYVEEVGSMNIMFKIDGKVYTAATVGTVLPGVTRRSCIELLKDWGYEVVEGKIAIADIMAAAREGKLEEVSYIQDGEPLVRKKDLMRICEKYPDCEFLSFTNGTLIDEEFCQEMLRVKNFVPAISLEGSEEANDGRRGEGVYQKVMHAMELLKAHKLPFGVSTCYTSANVDSVSSEEIF